MTALHPSLVGPPKRLLGVFAKYWEPGSVKTRLARVIGAQQASALHLQFLTTLLNRLHALPVERVLCYSPASREPQFRSFVAESWSLWPQSGGDLGERMAKFFRFALDAGNDQVVLLGSDSPHVPLEFIEQAFTALEQSQVVLGPSDDGGYYLVGVSGPLPDLFAEVAWSTQAVWEQTVERLRAASVPFASLPRWYDVDEFADLERLASDLSGQSDPALQDLKRVVQTVIGT